MKRITYKASILFASSLLCFFLQYKLHFTPVIAAACTGLLGTLVPKPKNFLQPHFEALVLAGAFISMGSFFALHSFLFLILASFLAAIFYVLLEFRFHGLGGRIGFIAFISSTLSLILSFLLKVIR